MFVTCETYRQASWAPDVHFGGTIVSSTTFSSQTFILTTFTGTNSSQTGTVPYTTVAQSTEIQTIGTFSTRTPQGNMVANGTSELFVTAGTQVASGSLRETSLGQILTTYATSSQFLGGTAIATTFTLNGLFGTGTSGHGSTTIGASTLLATSMTIFATNTSNLITVSTSTIVNASTTAATNATFTTTRLFPTAIGTLVTTTFTTLVAILTTTSAMTTLATISVSHGSTVTTTISASTIIQTGTTAAITVNQTTATTTATPSWWGWSSDIGTLLLASANGLSDDLPAWASGIGTGAIAEWNLTAGAQTTIWAQPPSGTVGAVATLLSSAASPATSISMLTATATTFYGTFTATSTTTPELSAFTNSTGGPGATNAAIPISTITCVVTGFGTISVAGAQPVLTPINTTTILTTSTQGTVSFSHVATIGFESSYTLGGTLGLAFSQITTFTITIMTSGYSTAQIDTGFPVTAGVGGQTCRLAQTAIIESPAWSLTTTTTTGQWFYDWSSPTQLVNALNSSSHSTTVTNAGLGGSISTGTGSTQLSSIGGFTRNVWASPYADTSYMVAVTDSTGGTTNLLGNAGSWSPFNAMQGFSPWTAPSVTYQNLTAPAAVTSLPFMAAQTGQPIGFNAFGTPVSSTGTGIWMLAPKPVTTSFSTTTGTGATTTYASIAYYSAGSSIGIGSTRAKTLIQFPTNLDEAAATIGTYSTNTFTTTTGTGATVTSTSSVSGGTVGITFQNPITSTFVESYATTPGGTVQNFPGIGGTPKLTSSAQTVYCRGAAVSLFGWGGATSNTWSSSDPNFFAVVIGAKYTTTSSATTNLGAGSFAIYTFPGQASIITSPCLPIFTQDNRYAPGITLGTRFWQLPNALLTPHQTQEPQ